MFDLNGKKVFITGAHGFLGSYVQEELKKKAVHLLTPSHKELDLLDEAAVFQYLKDEKPHAIVHLAAVVGGIGANRRHPGEFFYKNLMMGAHVMEGARRAKTEKILTVGTICAYPKFTPVPFLEENLWMGYPEETNAPYGIAKKALLVMGQAYRQEYGTNAIYLLPVNLYGPRDNFDPESSHVIPALIRKMVEAKDKDLPEVEIWGDGSPSREFLHAKDAARGIVMALEGYNAPLPVNLGTGMEITIKDLAHLIAEKTGFKGKLRFNPEEPNGQPRRSLDTQKALKYFGFKAEIPFEDGIAETIAYWEKKRLS